MIRHVLVFSFLSIAFLGCVPAETTKKPDPKNLPVIVNDPLPNGFRICIIGDAGSGNSEQYMVGSAMAKENCDQVRFVGDIIYEKGLANADDKQFKASFYNPYKEMLDAKPPVQFFLVFGNHDYGGDPTAWFDIAKRYPDRIKMPDYYYAESYGDICFVTFDTNQWYDEQTKWMQTIGPELKKTCKVSFALGHHPYLNAGEQRDEVNEKAFIAKNALGKFSFYLAGHDHNLQDEGAVQGTRLLISGAGGNGLYPFEKTPVVFGNDQDYGYIVLDLQRDENNTISTHYKFVTVDNSGSQVVNENTISFP